MDQINIFEMLYDKPKVDKPVRLIELFAGYGSQALALKYLGAKFEHWKIAEWNYKSFDAYNRIHFGDTTNYSKDKELSWLINYLYDKGISSNWDSPMTLDQIKRLSEAQIRKIYNDIQATHNLVNIQQTSAKDLDMNDNNYYYLLTYSFPCQDLSLAGLGKGMVKESGTRSSLLWEIDRILKECHSLGKMPDALVMENVPQIHGADNSPLFDQWQLELEKLGYQSYWKDLVATDYGIPQTRTRTFMVSIRNGYYSFPATIPLIKKLRDVLESQVDPKYYLSEKVHINFLESMPASNKAKRFASSITTSINNMPNIEFQNNIATVKVADKGKLITGGTDVATTLMSRDYKGFANYESAAVAEIKPAHGYFPGTIKYNPEAISTIDASIDYQHIVLGIYEFPHVIGGIGERKSNSGTQWYNQNRVYQGDAAVTIPAESDFHPNYAINEKNSLRIRKLTPTECFRLMGVKDADSSKLAGLSNTVKYHLAGDSIVTTVLMAIFGELLEIPWESKVKSLFEERK